MKDKTVKGQIQMYIDIATFKDQKICPNCVNQMGS